jgi:sugar lactone lactonase YvrE
MMDEPASAVERVIAPPSAPAVLVEDAGHSAHNLWWDEHDDSLWWTDPGSGAVFRLNLQTRIQSAVYQGPPVGAFVPQADHTWLLFREKDVARLDFDRHAPVDTLLENVRFDGDRFQAAMADPTGRILAGTVRDGRPNGAGIYRLDVSGTLSKLLGGTGAAQGLAWNLKGDALYWTCGTTRTICRCKYDVTKGALTHRQVFYECTPEEGTPTALALDAEGTLWSARRETGTILKIGQNRELRGQVTLPLPHVLALAFGGADRRTLFFSARGSEGASKIFTLQAPVAGAERARARVQM